MVSIKEENVDSTDYELRELFEDVTLLRRKGVVDQIWRGISNQPAQVVDNSVVSDVSFKKYYISIFESCRNINFTQIRNLLFSLFLTKF